MNGQSERYRLVLFADMAGHSRIVSSLTQDQSSRLYSAYRDLAEKLADRFGCDRWKFLGDGHMFAFETAAPAVNLALKLMADWKAAFTQPRLKGLPTISLRCGAHCGLVSVQGNDLVGRTCNVAKRVEEASKPDCLLITEAVLDHLDQAKYDWAAMSSFSLKGDHLQQRQLYRVTGTRPPARGKKMTAEDWFLRAVAML